MVDANGTISIEIKDEHWEAITNENCLKEFAYRGGLSHKYNADVKRVRLVRKSDRKEVVVWPSK